MELFAGAGGSKPQEAAQDAASSVKSAIPDDPKQAAKDAAASAKDSLPEAPSNPFQGLFSGKQASLCQDPRAHTHQMQSKLGVAPLIRPVVGEGKQWGRTVSTLGQYAQLQGLKAGALVARQCYTNLATCLTLMKMVGRSRWQQAPGSCTGCRLFREVRHPGRA